MPGATLKVFSDAKIYQANDNDYDYSVYYELARVLPGVEFCGSVSQTELAEALRQADGWLYPTTFVETSCIALMEAGSAGCALICSSVGALPDTANGFATLLDPPSNKATWSKQFAAGVVAWVNSAQANPTATRALLERQYSYFQSNTWDTMAVKWEEELVRLVSGASRRY